MTQTGYNFCQNGVRDRLAVSDDAVEVKNQCTHYFNSGERPGFAFLICGLASKWTVQPKAVEHLPLHYVSIQRRRLGRLRLVDGLDAIESLAEIALRDLNVIVVLQIEPKPCRCAECL